VSELLHRELGGKNVYGPGLFPQFLEN
jgi:hypothetical protein